MDIYVPSWREAELIASCSLSGSIHWKLINEERRDRPVIAEGKQSNMLMQGAIDKWLGAKGQSGGNQPMSLVYIHSPYFDYCLLNSFAIGTSDLALAKDQTALGAEAARVVYGYQFLPATSQGFYVLGTYIDTVFTFGPDIIGNFKEWGVFSTGTAATGMLCRELFRDKEGDPITIAKTSSQSLSITYRLQVKRTLDAVKSTINMGGIDYECSTSMSDKQLMVLLGATGGAGGRLWRNVTSANYANLFVGDSNAPSDLLGDTHNALKGTVLKSAKVTTAPILSTYTDGSNSRTLTMNIAAAECNGDIGEILMPMDAYESSENYFVARSTFNPRIAKVSPQKLAIGFTLSVSI